MAKKRVSGLPGFCNGSYAKIRGTKIPILEVTREAFDQFFCKGELVTRFDPLSSDSQENGLLGIVRNKQKKYAVYCDEMRTVRGKDDAGPTLDNTDLPVDVVVGNVRKV